MFTRPFQKAIWQASHQTHSGISTNGARVLCQALRQAHDTHHLTAASQQLQLLGVILTPLYRQGN